MKHPVDVSASTAQSLAALSLRKTPASIATLTATFRPMGSVVRNPLTVLVVLAACLILAGCGGSGRESPTSAPAVPDSSTPGESPAPTPDPPAVTKSVKRGIAYDLGNTGDMAALSPGVSWWYNYTLKPSQGVPTDYRERYGMEYIPMLWNDDFNDAEVEEFLKANPSIQYMLVLNEPNLLDQSNKTPQQAAQFWPRYEAIASHTGVKIVGPAIT